MPIADEPISPERLREIELEKLARSHVDELRAFDRKLTADVAKEVLNNAFTSIEHPDCRMTRMMDIVVAFWEKMGLHKSDEVVFHDFEKAFHDAAHEYAIEADWVSMNSDAMDRVELKKWAFEQVISMHVDVRHREASTEEADKLLEWLLKP